MIVPPNQTSSAANLPAPALSARLAGRISTVLETCQSSAEARTTWSALATLGPLIMIARLLAMCKAMMVARAFGSGSALDAFYIALMLPYTIAGVVTGSVSASFIPVYLHVKQHRGAEPAARLFASVSFLCLLTFLGCSVLLVLLSRTMFAHLASGFDASKLALTLRLFLCLIPTISLTGISVTWASTLNAEGHFAAAALNGSVSPVLLILALFCSPASWGVYTLAAGTVLGASAEVTLLGFELRRRGLRLMPRWHGFDTDVRAVVRQFAPGVTGSLWSSSSALVDQSMAAMLAAGSVASLNYGLSMSGAVLGVMTETLGTAVLPSFSRLVALHQWHSVRSMLRTYIWLALCVGIVSMAILMLFAQPLTALLFQRGAFGAENTRIVARIQAAFAIQVPAYLMAIVVNRLLAALQRSWVRTIGGLGNLILNVVFNYWFMQRYGITGIALSTSLVCIISVTYLSLMLRRELRIAEESQVTQS